MSGSSSQNQPTQSTSTNLSPQAQQLFNLAYPQIAAYAAGPPPQRWPGPTMQEYNPTQMAATDLARGAVGEQQRIGTSASDIAQSIPGLLQWGTIPGAASVGGGMGGLPGFSGYVAGGIPTSSTIWDEEAARNTLGPAIEAAQRPTWQALTEQALPAIRSTALQTGPTMGSRA